MSKAILLVEMPSNCRECSFYDTEIIPSCWANMNFKGRTVIYDRTIRQHFCPLKPMPQKKQVVYSKTLDYQDGYFADGYNACIDEILGEENGQNIT